MKTALILASAALCLSLAAASQAQKLTLTAARSGIIPAGGGVVGVSGVITNTFSDVLTITNDTITVVNGSVSQDFITGGGAFTQPILSGASYFGKDPLDPTISNAPPPFLFTVVYDGSSNPTDVTQGFVTLDYTLGTGANSQTFTGVRFDFPAAAATPEPGTLALLGSGLVSGGLLLARRRRK